MVDFREIIDTLGDWHFYDVLLPFILVYVVVFAILEKSKIFKVDDGDNSHVKNVNSVIAFVFGLFIVASIQTVQYIQSLIVNVVLILIFILVTLMVLGFIFGKDYLQLFMDKDGDSWKIKKTAGWIIGSISVLSVLGIFLWIIGWLDWFLDWLDDLNITEGDFTTVLVIIIVGAVLYWITKGGDSSSK